MRWPPPGTGVIGTPTGPLFDVVLLLHVASVVIGLITVVVSGSAAARCLADPRRPPAAVRRYFSGGPNWAGRVLYGVPVFGLVLLGLSKGAYGLSDTWVVAGLGAWTIGVVAAEGLLWPAERRIGGLLAAGEQAPAGGVRRDGALAPGPAPRPVDGTVQAELRSACRTVCGVAAALVVILVGVTVVMVAKP